MGIFSSKTKKENEILINFEKYKEFYLSDNIFSIIYKNKTIENKKIIFIEIFFENEDFLKKYITKIDNIKKFDLKNILIIKSIQSITEFNCCKNKYFSNLYIDYIDLNLEIEINYRSKKKDSLNKYFNENEVWYLIGTIVHTLNFLKKNKIYHKDIQPRNILISPNGEIKIFLSSYYFGFFNGYKKMLEDKDFYSCISPLQIESLKNEKIKVFHDREKSEVFSLGITILSILCLCNFKIFYDYDLFEIDFNIINKKIKKWSNLGYSNELIELIEFMIRPREDERFNYSNLIHYINPHFEPESGIYTSNFVIKKNN